MIQYTEDKMKGLIYKAVSPSGKIYVGQTTKSLQHRMDVHFYDLKNKKYNNNKFYNALKKYGFENFKWEIVCENIQQEHLNEYEKWYIWFYNSYKYGYNSTLGGEENPMKNPDSVRKMAKTLKAGYSKGTIIHGSLGKKRPDNADRNKRIFSGKVSHFRGKNHSEQTKLKMSQNHANFKLNNHPKFRQDICLKSISQKAIECEFSLIEVSKALNCDRMTIFRRINNSGFPNWRNFCESIKK